MATSSYPEVDCTCPVCCDIFKDPVVLLCGHSFCKDCLQEWWRQSQLKTCPLCKELFKMRQPPRNLALKNVSDTMRQEISQRASAEKFCSVHGEKLKLYCQDDQQPVCVICRDAKQHKNHNCVPINEAAEDLKTQLKGTLKHLQRKIRLMNSVKLNNEKIASHIQLQAQQTETGIKAEFKKFYQFLKAEEAARIKAMRNEAVIKGETMKIQIVNLTIEICTLRENIQAVEDELKANDLTIMLNFKSTMKRAQCTLADPKSPPGALIDQAKHLGNLQFNVWCKMKAIIQYSKTSSGDMHAYQIESLKKYTEPHRSYKKGNICKAPVILDPNSANTDMRISENLTRCTIDISNTNLPNNPERSDIVLGSEAIISGRHQWDVEMESYWIIGVNEINKGIKHGFRWSIVPHGSFDIVQSTPDDQRCVHFDEKYSNKIRVQLDYDQGKLSFSDLDRKVVLITLTCKFTKPVYPFFEHCVKILPADFSVSTKVHS